MSYLYASQTYRKKPGPHNKEAQQKIFLSIVEPLFILYDKI